MISGSRWLFGPAMLAASVLCSAQSALPVLQRGYDANVSGANLAETVLKTTNVGVDTFGLLFNLHVDAGIWAQPLYVPNVAIPGKGTHNVLYVATMNDTVYAFDADRGGAPLWTLNLANVLNTTPVLWANFEFSPFNVNGNLGILSTPVIDPLAPIMYIVACTLENGTMAYRLHAIDITSGLEPYGEGVLITGSYGGTTFDAQYQTQRVSLVLSGNQVVVGFAAMEEEEHNPHYVGWLMAYDKTTLMQSGIFATVTEAKGGGGIWQSGRPPAVDGAGYIYVYVGNAWDSGGYDGVNNFGESVLKLDPSQGLALLDWFTPGNWSYLDLNDFDFSSSGPMLIPGTTLLAGGGKTGILYVLDSTNLGKYTVDDSQVVQKEMITTSAAVAGGHIMDGPVYWNRTAGNGGPLMYNWGGEDALKAYPFSGGQFAANPSAQSLGSARFPGGALSISANGDQTGTALVWATTKDPSSNSGILHAFDAADVSNELWNSMMFPTRDAFGNFSRFVPPVVANGKVYAASLSNRVGVFSVGVATPQFTVNPAWLWFGNVQPTTTSTAQTVTLANTSNAALPISITFSGLSASQFSQTNTCGSSVPAGSPCTVSVTFTPSAAGAQTALLNLNMGSAGTKTTALNGAGFAPFTVSTSSLAFGKVNVNTASAAQTVTVTNTGSAALPITGITVTGANAAQYSQTNTCGTSVPAGSNCTISLVFTPTGTGGKPATLNVSGGPGVTDTVALSGTGSVSFSLLPSKLAFGNVPANTSSTPRTLSVTNKGGAALPISSISFSGANASSFSQTNTCGGSIPAGSACVITVVFTPTTVGTQAAALKVVAPGVSHTANLTGAGV